MYLVVSHWQVVPGHQQQASAGHAMRNLLRAQDGVTFIESFDSDGKIVVVHGYKDEATYNHIVSDTSGVFEKAALDNRLEEHLKWMGSERGTTRTD